MASNAVLFRLLRSSAPGSSRRGVVEFGASGTSSASLGFRNSSRSQYHQQRRLFSVYASDDEDHRERRIRQQQQQLSKKHRLNIDQSSEAALPLSIPLYSTAASLATSKSKSNPSASPTLLSDGWWYQQTQTAAAALFRLQTPKKGSGFDNFIPKNSKETDSDKEADSSKDTDSESGTDKEDSTSAKPKEEKEWSSGLGSFKSHFDNQKGEGKSGDSGGSGGGSGGGGGDNNSGFFINSLLLLTLVYVMTRNPDEQRSSTNANGNPTGGAAPGGQGGDNASREISWHDFLQLLEQQDVAKIVIRPTGTTASVYLKTSSNGLTGTTAIRGSNNNVGQGQPRPSYQERRRQAEQARNGERADDGYHNQAQDQVDGLDTNPMANKSHRIGGQQGGVTSFRLQIGSIDSFERKLDEAQRALGRDVATDVPVQYVAENTMASEAMKIVPGLLLAAVMYAMLRMAAGAAGGAGGGGGMGGVFQMGKSTAKKIKPEDVKINFSHVAGCDEAKKEIMEFVDFLKDSERFTKLGAKIPKGALLCGPPGTGKTLLAKAVAGEAGVPFYSISGSDFIEMFVGVGPSRVRDLFSEARANAPCIVFIDEIDAVGRQRGRGGMGGNDERENTLNQLLVEMDGFETSTGVVVLAGTNRADVLDQALTRPGRFDRQITIDKPDLKGRQAIFKVHLDGIKLQDSVDDISGRLAGLTPGFAGADIANMCNEAAIVAARRSGETVSLDDFEKATDRIIGGLESNKIMSKEERSIVAHHEAGHAVAGWFLEHADPLMKVTIIPRTSGALGFAQYLPKEVNLRTQDQIMDIVCMALAGRAAEEIFFGRVTTGASDDLRRVTEIVYSTIQLYGMNSRLGQLSFPKDPNAMWEDRPYSEKTAKAMDEEARTIVDAAYERTLNLLKAKKTELGKVANMLLEKETITHDDVVAMIGDRPFEGDPAYKEFISRRKKDKAEHGETIEAEIEDSSTEAGPLTPGLA
jgi:AFG3 family protein